MDNRRVAKELVKMAKSLLSIKVTKQTYPKADAGALKEIKVVFDCIQKLDEAQVALDSLANWALEYKDKKSQNNLEKAKKIALKANSELATLSEFPFFE